MSIESSLQNIASEHLSKSRHGCEDVNHHKTQLEKVYNALMALFKKHPDLLDILHTDCRVVPALTTLEDVPHMENIGDSAEECLKLVPQDSMETHWDIVKLFLEKVQTQAQSATARDIESNDASVTTNPFDEKTLKMYIERFDECLADVKMRQEEIEGNVIKAETAACNAQKSADGVAKQVCAVTKQVDVARRAVNMSQKAAKKATITAAAAKNTADKAEKTADNMMPNMLSVLSIFIGVVIAVVACYLTILLGENNAKAIAAEAIPLAFMFAWMMGHVLVMAIFMLFFMIAKLTDRTIICNCHHYTGNKTDSSQDCKQCPKATDCKPIKRLRSRFPYVYWVNILFFVGYIVIGVVHIINLYYAPRLNPWIREHLVLFPLICLVVIGAVFLFIQLIRLIVRLIRKKKPSSTCQHP